MAKKWLNWINLSIAILVGLCLLIAGVIAWTRPNTIEPRPPVKETLKLPKPGFHQPNATPQLNEGLLKLKNAVPSVQLPNLRNTLTYYGRNSRPDADPQFPLMHLNLTGNKDPASILPKQKLYLSFDRSGTPAKYVFSPNNAPTPLWIEATPYQAQAMVDVFLLDDGKQVRKPSANAQFTLPEKEYVRYGGTTWEMGKWRVDGTLLARQKARWYGQDLFLDHHGGQEYAQAKGKQRIDFGEGDEAYSIFVTDGSCVIWKDDRWQNATPGPDTRTFPLMCIKKIDTRLMNLELWDVNGRGKVMLNLLKSIDTPLPKTLQQTLKFVGARTLTQFLFEVNQQRIILRPNDWLLFKDNRWQLLNDPATIKKFVDRQIIGPLFVFEGVGRKDDRQILKGTIYNPTRTEAQEVEIPLVPAGGAKGKKDDDKKRVPVRAPSIIPSGAPSPAPTPAPAVNTRDIQSAPLRNIQPAPVGPIGGGISAQGANGPLPPIESRGDDDDDDDDDDDFDDDVDD